MIETVRAAAGVILGIVRSVDASVAEGGIGNAREAVRANAHRSRIVAAARDTRSEDAPGPPDARRAQPG